MRRALRFDIVKRNLERLLRPYVRDVCPKLRPRNTATAFAQTPLPRHVMACGGTVTAETAQFCGCDGVTAKIERLHLSREIPSQLAAFQNLFHLARQLLQGSSAASG